MAAALQNLWYHRRVADAQAKACWICFKPSSSVLITPDSKDFFYICPGHLKDRGFCEPDADEAAAVTEKKKKEEMDREIQKIKDEYGEKQRRKKEKRKEKEKEQGKDKEKDKEGKDEETEDKKDEKERDDKAAYLHPTALSTKNETKADDGPRIFTLKKNFYQMRIKRIRDAEAARRNKERFANPSLFPSAPTGDL
ncbi:VPS4-associated protein 1 [Macrophomina phaseolina]|uniref:VPS4-associated protein 1 n=1 Tax=Macrophomina phaseolina TaxID=35725 RepID=A0ABQ8GJJ8_9PEZI|nr:VPS4-associated protein 1 [Macrophomina phaseolina]